MAIKNIIANGIGFSPNGPGYIVTHGFGSGEAIVVAFGQPLEWKAQNRRQDWSTVDRETGWNSNRRRHEWGRRI